MKILPFKHFNRRIVNDFIDKRKKGKSKNHIGDVIITSNNNKYLVIFGKYDGKLPIRLLNLSTYQINNSYDFLNNVVKSPDNNQSYYLSDNEKIVNNILAKD